MHVDNLDRALTFFAEILGFKTVHSQRGYAYVHRETVGFRIMQNQGTDGAPPGNRRFAKRFLADGRQYGYFEVTSGLPVIRSERCRDED